MSILEPGAPGAHETKVTLEAKMTLVETLKMFNRKERHWLVRNALRGKSVKLDPEFLESIERALPIIVPKEPEEVWWAMDFLLTGLLALFSWSTIKAKELHIRNKRTKNCLKATKERMSIWLLTPSRIST